MVVLFITDICEDFFNTYIFRCCLIVLDLHVSNLLAVSSLPYMFLFSHSYFVLFIGLLQMLSSKDLNFVGYTYKNFEIVNDYQVPGMGTSLFSLFTYEVNL